MSSLGATEETPEERLPLGRWRGGDRGRLFRLAPRFSGLQPPISAEERTLRERFSRTSERSWFVAWFGRATPVVIEMSAACFDGSLRWDALLSELVSAFGPVGVGEGCWFFVGRGDVVG